MRRRGLPLLVLVGWLVGCTVLNPLDAYESGDAASSGAAGRGGDGAGTAGSGGEREPSVALQGRVLGPDKSTAVLHARVSIVALASPPTPAPRGISCGRCEALAGSVATTLSDASGDFALPLVAPGAYHLVVEKAGFRRVRPIEVGASPQQAVPSGLTTLPSVDDPESGDEVPAMTMVTAHWDEAEITLAQLGLSPKAIQTVSSEPIDEAAPALLRDFSRLGKSRFLFLPSGNLTGQTIDDLSIDLAADAAIIDNLRRFVRGGGTLYVTDLHYDFVARAFPGFVRWRGESAVACSGCHCIPCGRPSWVDAQVDDPDLSAWLSTQGVGAFELAQSYTAIAQVSSAEGVDAAGQPTTITPTIWMREREHETGLTLPALVTFPYGCGSVVFGSFARPPYTPELIPQVRALWGALLEASSCAP